MKRTYALMFACLVLVLLGGMLAHAQNAINLNLNKSSVTQFQGLPLGGDNANVGPELNLNGLEGDADADAAAHGGVVNRSFAKGPGQGAATNSARHAKSNPEMTVSFDGLNFWDQRYANSGNQFSIEPPDQGLCAGNGRVLEVVNTVMNIHDAAGNSLLGVTDLNSFYGYPAEYNRSNGHYGPSITDPSCLFDAATQRWFLVVLTLDVVPSGPYAGYYYGTNHLDLAVSQTSDPLAGWNLYTLPVQNDGTQGTPNHNCVGGPCLGDYPHMGADANGIYLTTNEFAFVDGYRAAQIYAFSKQALAAGSSTVPGVLFDTYFGPYLDGTPGFTVWPAISPAGQFKGNTEYFLSSQAVWNDSGMDNRLRIWSISNTQSLNTSTPNLTLSAGVIDVAPYAVPPKSNQKAGDNNTGNYYYGIGGTPVLDSNDSRMQQVYYANGKLWAALDTAINVGGEDKAGVAYYVVNPSSGKVDKQGYLALAGNNLTYPAVGVLPNGRGVITFTLVGDDYYPTAAYAPLDAIVGAGDIRIAALGQDQQDGFSEYAPYYSDGSPRPRWGDYGATAVDGNTIWVASEYIATNCTWSQYMADKTCGHKRAILGNWATRITQLVP